MHISKVSKLSSKLCLKPVVHNLTDIYMHFIQVACCYKNLIDLHDMLSEFDLTFWQYK